MSFGNGRKEWQELKRKYPGLEQTRAVKTDVGPLLDKFDKMLADWRASQRTSLKKLEALRAASLATVAAIKGYEPAFPPAGKADFKKFRDEEQQEVDEITAFIKDLHDVCMRWDSIKS
jgi:hypothetical protein